VRPTNALNGQHAVPTQAMQEALTILHTNDFHNRLTSTQADRLKRLRDDLGPNGLLLDAGDAIGAGNVTFRPAGEPILNEMSEIGYDAMTVGNREFHVSRFGFCAKLKLARFPVLCANVRPVRGRETAPVMSHICRDLPNGMRIVVLGVTVPMITERMASRRLSAYLFDDPIQAAARCAAQLRATLRPNLLVALTHIGLSRDRELASAVPEIDLIIGGHTHDVLEKGERVGETLIAQAGSHGRYVGRIDIEWDDARDRRPRFCATLEPLC